MFHKTTNIEELLSPYKTTRRDDTSLLLEESTSMLTGILLFCPASIIYGFIILDNSSAIILSCVVLFILGIFRIVAAFDRPIIIDINKGHINLTYLRIFGGKRAVNYDLSMIKGIYPEPYFTKYGFIACVRLLLTNNKSIKIFNSPCGKKEAADTNSDLVAKIFSDLLGTQIVYPK